MIIRNSYAVLDEAAEVRKAEKQTHYTITEIGGQEAHEAWKLEQIKFEAAYQAKMEAIRLEHATKAAEMVASGAGETASRKLTPEERVEVAYTIKKNIADNRQEPHRFVTEAQNEAAKPKVEVALPKKPRKTLGSYAADFISKAFEK